MRVAGTASVAANQGIATATRRTSDRMVVTPGADHVVAGGVVARACSFVSNGRKPKPWRSTGSTQYPATNPGAARTLGKISLVNAAAAAGASAGSIVKCISAACVDALLFPVLAVLRGLRRVLVSPADELMQGEGDFVGMRCAPGNDALELEGIVGDGSDFHQLGFDDLRPDVAARPLEQRSLLSYSVKHYF